MNAITRCPMCRGSKKMLGLGMMERDCEKCAGKGHVMFKEIKEVKPDVIVEPIVEPVVEPVKEEAVKDDRETETKAVTQIKRKYVRKDKEETPAQHGVCDVA